MKLTDQQTTQLKSVLSELAVAAPRLSAALQGTTLLLEVTAWAHVLGEQSRRLLDMDLDLEVQASTSVKALGEIPGAVFIHDLDTLRVPTDLRGLIA